MPRQKVMSEHPQFPWLDPDSLAVTSELCRTEGWLRANERIESTARAGQGNMNLVLRLSTNQRTLILKQSRPWVEKYDHIPAPWDRIESEATFYQLTAGIPAVQRRSPEIFGFSTRARAMLMSDLAPCHDMSGLYADPQPLNLSFIESLADYLAGLHTHTMGEPDLPPNSEMRRLNHEHIFRFPLQPDNGLDLDAFEPGLKKVAHRLIKMRGYNQRVESLGKRYLQDGPCLCHGDSFPGSWLHTSNGLAVIDPEFCLPGDPEFDLGFTLAHLALTRQPIEQAQALLAHYHRRKGPAVSLERIADYAFVEVMRRLIGVAQLPIPVSTHWRAEMLERTIATCQDQQWTKLWPSV